ncbi:bifunctional sugar phosphate isomerase/epimerase/4-hydroxyphenylpyruvate dioxygenase family protein [Anianabacter salinae]|uniref:bifunctional sugar phosphate isomerase/epimerase/4-hydroxyphenylpyruvate dioxygenase family protein n=1 Tax=Anianabacter salinae TaxID=2851023 RepID=UPI00225E5B2D|nr:sugar phosphate isomerase/epimerase and 4-hydroxyphenylpyruvate domain-containing protein [Anianabacter salinae]MBV0912060.1 sugar phosphate isomerase/epimerase and 4-hydroxyphenylpyruvate domain-containing protein [Anianabacter salinae]
MRTGIATVSISGNLEEKIEAIAAAGFDGIEIFEQDFIADARSPRQIGQLVRDAGLDVMLFQPFRDFECLPEPLRSKAFDRARHKFDTMAELGTDLMLICSSVHPQSLGGIDRAADDLAALGEIASERGLRVGYEALAWGRHIDDHRNAWEIVRRADHPNVGLILDSFHTLGRGLDPETIRAIPGDRIFFVQLADAPLIDMDLLYWSRHFRNMPGEGDLDITRFMRSVMATGYDGPISLEIFNDQFRGGNARIIAEDGHRSLVALMDDVKRAEPQSCLTLPALPARVAPTGVSFVEFAARGDEAERLANALTALGFSHAARHRNKAIDLFTQGDIRIVLNRDDVGHAAHSWNARGTCVCDIGLGVASAADTVTRAAALGLEPFGQPLGPGERDIPAIRGLSGSVLHFLDPGAETVWDEEFLPLDHADSGAGLTRIDHVAQTMSYSEMLSWTLFYTALFDMRKSPMVDVVDPDGLVRSQAVEAPGGQLRVTLNGADTHRTFAGSFLAESFGSSVQHIALSTDDILETARVLRARGFEGLAMPENYYSDLTARFDLPADLLARMRAANILYDADDRGAFFQLYSVTLPGGIFIEIVQRTGAYGGYGAPNAPFRIAAQKRAGRRKGMPRA